MNCRNLTFLLLAAALSACTAEEIIHKELPVQSFHAGIDITRTSLADDVNVLWTPGDCISMYDARDGKGVMFTTELSSPSQTATFTGSGAKRGADNYYYAVYPYSSVNSWQDSLAFYTIPNVQTGREGQVPEGTMVMAARTSDLEKGMMFSHRVAYMKFTVEEKTEPFVSFKVVPTVGKNISGGFKIAVGTESMALSNDSGSKRYQNVELRTADGKPFGEGDWYLAFYPSTYDSGFDFTFTDAGGSVCSVSGPGEKITVGGGDVLDLGTVKGLSFVNMDGLVGTVYEKDGDKGVIWKADPSTGTATLVSAWSSSKIAFCSGDMSKLSGSSRNTNDGAANTAVILASDIYKNGGLTWAITNCTAGKNGFGEGWYLPARYQLNELYDAYYGLEPGTSQAGGTAKEDISGKMNPEVKKKFDDAMAYFGSERIDKAGDSTGLWSSTLNSGATDAFIVRFNTTLYSQHKPYTNTEYMRCFKDVKL